MKSKCKQKCKNKLKAWILWYLSSLTSKQPMKYVDKIIAKIKRSFIEEKCIAEKWCKCVCIFVIRLSIWLNNMCYCWRCNMIRTSTSPEDCNAYEPRCEKTGLRGFRPGLTQTGLYSYRRCLEAWNFGFSKEKDCTIRVAKTKALISFAVTAKLICVFVFAYAKSRFSHDEAHI